MRNECAGGADSEIPKLAGEGIAFMSCYGLADDCTPVGIHLFVSLALSWTMNCFGSFSNHVKTWVLISDSRPMTSPKGSGSWSGSASEPSLCGSMLSGPSEIRRKD